MSDWLTYAEAAQRFGLSSEAVRQMAIRRKWSRRRLNSDPHGAVQVEIPDDDPIRTRTPFERPDKQASDTRPSDEVQNLRELATAYRIRAERAEAEADRTIAALKAEREQAAALLASEQATRRTAEAEAAEARQRATQAEHRAQEASAAALAGERALEAERAARVAAEVKAAQLEAAAEARKARGLIERLLAAWRG